MAVVVILATGAVIAIKLYGWVVAHPAVGIPAMESIKRQAAVVGTLAASVFLLCEALEKMKLMTGGAAVSSGGVKWMADQARATVHAAMAAGMTDPRLATG